MYGHEGVSRDLKRRMESRVPAHLAAIRLERGATTTQLPDPRRVKPHFIPDLDVDDYPAICVTELDTPTGLTGSRGIHAQMAYTSYTYRYPFRVFVYVMGATYGDVELQLKRYLTAMRMALLEDLTLTATDQATVIIDATTVTENFFPPDEDSRSALGAGYLAVVLESEEVINVVGEDGTPAPVEEGPYAIHADLGRLPDDSSGPGVGHEPLPDWLT